MLIETAVRRNSAQYFLLTPKLLPNLNYDRGVTVLIVYNGDDMAEFTRWNNDEFLTQEETYRYEKERRISVSIAHLSNRKGFFSNFRG